MDEYPLVNRCALVIKAQPPFWEWVKKNSYPHAESLPELFKDSNIYLVPDYESEQNIYEAIEKYLQQHYRSIFINELTAWYTDPEMFPEITFENFQKWFTVSSHTMIFDMVKKSLKKE